MPTLRATRQLPLTVLAKSDNVSGTDHLVNRFSAYGEVSAMSALLASNLPVYRLKVQLRMTRGMFDLVAKLIYPDVPFTYQSSRAINNPEFKVEHGIDGCFHAKFPELSAAIQSLSHGSVSTDTPRIEPHSYIYIYICYKHEGLSVLSLFVTKTLSSLKIPEQVPSAVATKSRSASIF